MPDILTAVKLAMRLTRNIYDPEIYRLIDAAAGDLALAGVPKPERSASGAGEGVTVSVDARRFAAEYPASGQYSLAYDGQGWKIDGTAVDPDTIGITVAGSPDAGTTVAVISSYSTGDPVMLEAIITYCRLNFGTPDDYDRLKRSYDEQKAQLMSARGYGLPEVTPWRE